MPANRSEPRAVGSMVQSGLTWLGGGERHELDERRQQSTHLIAGVVVIVGAALAWLVAALAIAESTRWPTAVVVPLTAVFGLFVGAVSRGVAGGPTSGWAGVAGRTTVAVAVGVVVGELTALVLLAGSIDRRLDERAARAESVPAVAAASAALERTLAARTQLDGAVEQARRVRDEALVVARCEYNPSPACPQTQITGVPGAGPETRTANEFLEDAQRQLETAVAERDQRAAELDPQIIDDEHALEQAQQTAIADADRGLGARWAAMNDVTSGDPGTMVLRLLSIGFFVLLILLPMILKQWRGETTHDRRAAARAERDRAELEADTAIAVKRAEVRAATEMMWAEQQLAGARLAVQAQTEIEREQQRRRVIEALEAPVQAGSRRVFEPVDDETSRPISAEPQAAGQSAGELAAAGEDADAAEKANLPARAESDAAEPRTEGGSPLVPTIQDITKTATRWLRPFVPPVVASAIDTTTKPLRGVRQIFDQVFEEVEETHLTLRRTHKVTIRSESAGISLPRGSSAEDIGSNQLEHETTGTTGTTETAVAGSELPHGRAARPELTSTGSAEDEHLHELTHGDQPRELPGPQGPPELPSAE